MNRKKCELEECIRNGEYGMSTQFFYSAEKEFKLVSDFSAYDLIDHKFECLKQDLKLMLEQKRSSTSQAQPEAKLNMLSEKYKTPFDKRTFSVIPRETQASSSESNRSKKRTAEEAQPLDDKNTKVKKTKKTAKKKKKTKGAKPKEETDTHADQQDNPSKKAKLDEKKKSQLESPSLVRLNKLVPKTPMTNRLSSRIHVHSSIRKTVKSKPLTRRAAAALAAAKSNQEGHVKKMVSHIEQKILPTPQTQRKMLPQSSIQKTISKLKALRSSIDKRKSAVSLAKLAAKRKSEKQVKAFLSDLKDSKLVLTDQTNNRISINAKTEQEKSLVSDMMSKSPQLVLAKMPSSLTQPKSVSANIAGKVMEKSEHRFSKELLLNSSVLSQYRPVNLKSAVSTSAIKATPSKPVFGSCGNLTSQHLYSKYTPSKLTRTEIDEKKKADLLVKEQREKERLAELDRLKQEKLNEAKRKRDEKLKKVNEAKQKQKEDAEQKAKELELKEKQRLENDKMKKLNNSSVVAKQSVMLSAQKKNVLNPVNLNLTKSTMFINKDNCTEFVNSFKKSLQMSQQFQAAQKLHKQKTVILLKGDDKNNLEQTYVLNSPCKKAINQSSYDCTPLQAPKLKDNDNYDVSDIRSDDDTDDEDEPSKPIPVWAKEPLLSQKAQDQCLKAINFTRLFKSACQAEINLEQIFKTRRRKFVERSSSANWTTPPIWSTNGINGEESFMQLRKNL